MKHTLICLLALFLVTNAFNFREVQSISQTSKIINTLTNNTFKLDRTTDNSYTQTAYQSSAVSTTATVILIFPAVFSLSSSNVGCISISVDSVAVNNFTCTVSGNSVTFGGVFAHISNLNVATVLLTVGNILNPSPAITVSNFTGYIGVDYAVPLGASVIQLSPGSLQNCSITFSPGYVNLASSTLIASMTPSDNHSTTANLTIQFPHSTWTNDISSQSLPISSLMSCPGYAGNINNPVICSGNSASNLISLSNIFQATTIAPFSIGVRNFLSPPSNQPSDAIVITTFQGGYKLDTCTVYPTGLSPIAFSNFTITPLTTMVINSYVSLRFNMYPSMSINQSDYFSITFPSGTTYTYNQIYGTGYYVSPPTFSGQTVLIYHDTSSSAASYPEGSLYSLTFASFQAPPSTSPTDSITLQILRNGYPIMYGTAVLTATSASLSASVSVSSSIVWAHTTYTFTINTSNPLSATGMIKITFPSTVTPPSSQNCASLIGLSLNTVPTCTLDSGSNSIYISNLNASSTVTSIPTQNNIRLSIVGVVNPPDTATTSVFTVTTYYSANTQGIVDVGTIAGITSTIGTIAINTVSVVPSSYVCMQSGVTYSINFNNTYTIPINGYIVIQIPTDITIITALLPNYCRLSINGGSYSSTSCSSTTGGNGSYYQISFTTPAQTSAISADSLISLQVLTLCTNPTNTRIITPFAISTYSANAAIQSRTTGITVQMQTSAAFAIMQVTRISQQNSALTPYTITLKQQSALSTGTLLLITLPNEIFLTASSQCTDLAGTVLSCNEGSYHSMQVTLNAIASNTQFGVVISSIRNPPTYQPTATSFTFETKTADLVSSYASGTYSTPFINSVPSAFQQISYSFFPGSYGSTTEMLTLTVTPSSYAVPSAYIVNMAGSFTVQSLICESQVGFSAPYSASGPSGIKISGTIGSSQVSFSISGFTSPTYPPNDYTFISSYDSNGYLIDQNTATIKYAITCIIPCQTCTTNFSACLTCYNNSNITSNNLLFQANNSCLSSCPEGYYASTSLICTLCGSTCLTCNGSPSNCTSCNSTSTYPALNISGNFGQCLSNCPSYFYLSSSLSPTQCTSCKSPCLACSSLTTCLSCAPGFYYSNLTCQTICPSNISIANNGSWNCDACSSQCATCSGTVSTCTSCSASAAFYQGQCITQCPYPLVISGGICANCSTSCLTCSLTSYNCTSCSTSTALPYLLVTNASLGSCLIACPFTYYGDSSQGLCKTCASLNINCTNCSSTITCYNCDYGSGLVFYNSQCLSTTPVGYYNDSGIAKPCNANCSTCASATNCTSCTSLSWSNYQCVSSCPSNQVSVSKVCVACTYPCLTCSNIQTNCTSCNSTILSPYYLLQGSCLQICPNYTFSNPNGWICSTCVSPCEMCSTNASCSSCANGYNLYNQTCLLTCPLGQIGLNKICTSCTNNCHTCSGSTSNCLSCNVGTYLYNSTSPSCSSTCPFGLYPNNSTQTCTGCTGLCLTCYGYANNCTQCQSGLLQSNQCVGSCSVGYYALGTACVACNSNCTQCTSSTICSSCASPLILSGTSCVTTCPLSSPIINSANQCSSCTDPSCVNCSSTNVCYQCFYPKLYFQGACLSNCPNNYAPDLNYTNCVYSPANTSNSSAAGTLSNSLISTSIFPVPFTIGAAFLIIACLMSKFQHSRTDIVASLYSLWGLLEWASISFLLVYYWKMGNDLNKLSYLLVAGGLAWIYLINIIFLFIQVFSLKKNRRFRMWLEGSINSCWYGTITFICLVTIGKIKFILFCKLFNFRSLSAKLDSIGGLRVLHAYSFASILGSLATLSGGIYLLLESNFVINQLLMSVLDVIVLSLLELILGMCNVNKESDYFEDIDQDGLQINKRIEIREEDNPNGIMPQFNESDRDSYRYKGFESAKKLESSYISEVSNHKSWRDISIQAESILGERSLISRLNTETISELSLFDRHDVSIQMDPVRDVQDVSVAASERGGKHDVSIGQSVIFLDASVNPSLQMKDMSINVDIISQKDVSIAQTQKYNEEVSVQFEPQQCEISIQMDELEQNEISVQYAPIYTDQTVHMTRDEEEFGIQCNADHQNISIQYSAKPLIEQIDGVMPSDTSLSLDQPSDLDLQRKLVLHPPAPQETGMRVQLELDIQEKLDRKRRQLQKLQEERKERERQEAIRDFQSKIERREVSVQMSPAEFDNGNGMNQNRGMNGLLNNDYSSSANSLVNSNQELTLNLQEKMDKKQKALEADHQEREIEADLHNFKKKRKAAEYSNETERNHLNEQRPEAINNPNSEAQSSLMHFNQELTTEVHDRLQSRQQILRQEERQQSLIQSREISSSHGAHQSLEESKERQMREINNFFNNDPSNNHPSSFIHTNEAVGPLEEASRVRTEQQFLEMLSGNQAEEPLQFSTEEVPDRPAGKVKFETANKVIENQEELIEEDEDLIDHYQPLEQNPMENPVSIQKSRSTAVLTKRPPLPRNKQTSNILDSSQNSIEKSYEEEDEIVNRPINPRMKDFHMDNRMFKKEEVERGSKTSLTQFLQKKRRNLNSQDTGRRNNLMEEDDVLSKELESQFRQKPLPAPSADFYASEQSIGSYSKSNRPPVPQRKSKRAFEQPDDLLTAEVRKSLNRVPSLPRQKSNKQLQVDVGIEKPSKSRSKGYLRETYTSQQKKKSLQKIYLNKVVKK